jgi:hypothetical protein
MGKDRSIKILGNVVGNLALHKILIRHTNKPESLGHLEREVEAYRDNALEMGSESNWNDSDLARIKSEALANFKKDIKKYYPDVKFPIDEPEELINEILREITEE